MAKLNFDKWMKKYRPVRNQVARNASCEGLMFETFGPELDFVDAVRRERPNTVWTIVETDAGALRMTNGYHVVNRFGYFVCEVPYEGPEVDFKYA